MSKGSKFCSASFVSKVQFFKILSLGWRVRWYEVFIFYIVKSTRWRSQWPVENCLAITKVDKVERGFCESKTAFPSLSSHPVDGLMCGKCIWSLSLPHRGADSKQACLWLSAKVLTFCRFWLKFWQQIIPVCLEHSTDQPHPAFTLLEGCKLHTQGCFVWATSKENEFGLRYY